MPHSHSKLVRVGILSGLILALTLCSPTSANAQSIDPLYTAITNTVTDRLLSLSYFISPKSQPSPTTTITIEQGPTTQQLLKGVYRLSATPPQGTDLILPDAVALKSGDSAITIGIVPAGHNRTFTYKTPLTTKPTAKKSLFGPREIAVLGKADTQVLGVTDTQPPFSALTTTTITPYIDVNRNGNQDPGEPIDTTRTITLGLTATDEGSQLYSLLNGWNLVHFPLAPSTFKTAGELVTEIAKEGGYVSVVATWQDGKWLEYVQRGDATYSEDFPITPGKAYFLRSHQKMDWLVVGTPVTPTSLQLIPGWNSVGLFLSKGQTAVNVLDTLYQSNNNTEAAPEIDRWNSGNWQVFVKRWYDEKTIEQYGDDFTLKPTDGYMIKSNDFLEVTLKDAGDNQ